MLEGIHPTVRRWMLNAFIVQFRTYSLRVIQPPDSEIVPLLIYKDAPSEAASVPSAPTQPSQPQSELEASYSTYFYGQCVNEINLTIRYDFSPWRQKLYKKEQLSKHLLYQKIGKKFQKRSQVMKHYLQYVYTYLCMRIFIITIHKGHIKSYSFF